MQERIAVMGLGYVGLPLALALARKFKDVVGFDVRREKIAGLRAGRDRTREISAAALRRTTLRMTCRPDDLAGRTFFIVAVPTPVDPQKRPDLAPLIAASETVGRALRPGAVVVYESTVYPGVTEDICGPVLARASGLKRGADFTLGYSPERINPGDPTHGLEQVIKIVAGEDAATLARVARVYGAVARAGIHRAPSIKVAEAAKVIENTQRDLNIALMNELALICDRLGIRTRDVLAAAETKWNFLRFYPGLVGGHCIGVDPYYLTTKAEELGYHPQVILAGRRINDGMGAFIGQRLIKLFAHANLPIKGARVGILGLTFKENVSDIRNSRVPDIVRELEDFGIRPFVHDPLADSRETEREYGFRLSAWRELRRLDALILAVPHRQYRQTPLRTLVAGVRTGGIVVDVKSILDPARLPRHISYWCL
jgi:UDP-N-acetyl-D-galactosamine dehydrogenase